MGRFPAVEVKSSKRIPISNSGKYTFYFYVSRLFLMTYKVTLSLLITKEKLLR
jgi:hypothetical protein